MCPRQRVPTGNQVILRHDLVEGGRDVGEGFTELVVAPPPGVATPDHLLRLVEHDVFGPDLIGDGGVVVA